MLKDTQTPRYAVSRTHRTYTPQFKVELVAACLQPGASIAALALQHGMNTNVLHRWLKEHRQGHHRLTGGDEICAPVPPPAFIPVTFDSESAAPVAANEQSASTPPSDIRLDIHRASTHVTVHWPVSVAAQCAPFLRELLR
jgi:transposase-like protein